MICIYYIGLQHPELCGTVPLLFTMSRPAVLGGLFLSCFACMHITRKLVEFYRPHVQCCMYTILFHLALIFLLTLWPNTPTLDTGKMSLDLQRGPKRNVSTRMNGVATECNQGDTARPLFFVNWVA